MLSVPRYSMGLKLTTRDPENFGLLILKVADGTAGSLLVFFEHWLMSFDSAFTHLMMLAINFRRPSLRTRCPNSGSVLLFSDPARLARIRVGVRDTSTFIVQVDVNIAGRWNMAEIALLPRRLAEWSGTPPRWYPLQLGGCQHDANRRAWWWKPQDQSPAPSN